MLNMLCCRFTASVIVVPTLLLKNTVKGFLCAELQIVVCFPRCSIHCMNVVRFPVLMFHQNKHINNTWRNRKAFLKWYSEALLLACKDFVHVSVFHEHVYGEHCMKTAHTHHPQQVQNQQLGDNAMHLEFCHWLHTNHQLLPLILFTDEATFNHNEINNIRNSRRWSHDNPHDTVVTNVVLHFSTNVWCSMIDDPLIGLTLDDCITRQNYLQNGLPELLEDVTLATRMAAYFQHDRTLLIIPELWWNISMTLSLIRLVMAIPLTGHQDWMKSEVYRKKWIHKTNCSIMEFSYT